VKVQPLSKELDYFACFGLPRRLTLDPAQLEAKYYELSRIFHPDFFQDKTELEKQISLGNTALVNAAYRTLKDPIQRAAYLVQLEAGSAKAIPTTPPADLFEDLLEIQENLEAFRSAMTAGREQEAMRYRTKLVADRERIERLHEELDTTLTSLFGRWDALQSETSRPEALRQEKDAVLKELRALLSNRSYLRNVLDDLSAALEGNHANRRH
jgi:molecular chaperone HscB